MALCRAYLAQRTAAGRGNHLLVHETNSTRDVSANVRLPSGGHGQGQNQPTSGLNHGYILRRWVRPSAKASGGPSGDEYVSTMLGMVLRDYTMRSMAGRESGRYKSRGHAGRALRVLRVLRVLLRSMGVTDRAELHRRLGSPCATTSVSVEPSATTRTTWTTWTTTTSTTSGQVAVERKIIATLMLLHRPEASRIRPPLPLGACWAPPRPACRSPARGRRPSHIT
jgi:hypothetical protein